MGIGFRFHIESKSNNLSDDRKIFDSILNLALKKRGEAWGKNANGAGLTYSTQACLPEPAGPPTTADKPYCEQVEKGDVPHIRQMRKKNF